MANRQLMETPSQLRQQQANDIISSLEEDIANGEIQDESQAIGKIFQSARNFFARLGKPTITKRYVFEDGPPLSNIVNQTFKETGNDIRSIFNEMYKLGEGIKKNFNHTVVERNKIRNKVKQIGDLVNDYMVSSKGMMHKNIILQDNFTNKDKIDESKVLGNKCRVSTDDGVVTLGITGSTDHSDKATLITDSYGNLPGNGLPGNFGIAIQTGDGSQSSILQGITTGESKGEEWTLLWSTDPHDNPTTMFDDHPDTWFEYGAINVPDDAKTSPPSSAYSDRDTKGYGWNFSDGSPIYYDPLDGNTKVLKLTLHIALPEARTINWITLNPYIPPGSGLRFTVDKIQMSEDDADYYTLPNSKLDIGSDTERTLFEYADVVDKFTGHGVWTFPSRKVKFIKIFLECNQKYSLEESTTGKVAHLYWVQSWTETHQRKYVFGLVKGKERVTQESKRVEGPKIDKEKFISDTKGAKWETGFVVVDILASLVASLLNVFAYEDINVSNLKIEPGLDIYSDGWRYAIGIRDIKIMNFNYNNSGSFVSKLYVLPKAIDTISLSVNEVVPKDFFEGNEATRNDWIKYYVSLDDGGSWHQISPLEYQQVAPSVPMPPKIISVNSLLPQDVQSLSKTYITTEQPAKTLRIKVEMSRPSDSDPTLSPILKQYRIIVQPKEVVQ